MNTSYRVRRVGIPKPNGGIRLLGIPTVPGRPIQQATAQCLVPLFDPGFSTHSYGFRPGRNARQAVHQIKHDIAQNRHHAVDIDLSKCFGRVNHGLLMAHLGRKVSDKRVLELTKRHLQAGVLAGDQLEVGHQGVPQGGPLSPLLANRNWGVSMRYQLDKLSQYLRGWTNYFGIASGYQRCVGLDHWIRRRIRMAYWRQWRKPRTKVRNLIRRGVPIQAAVACGLGSKGPWRSPKTPGIQQALSNACLKAEGLYSLRDGWVKLHHGE